MKPIEDMAEFEARVVDAYNNARYENGYITPDYTVRDVALDMIVFDAMLEEYDDDSEGYVEEMVDILVPIIKKVHHFEV